MSAATVSVSDTAWDAENNHNYYDDGPTLAKILSWSAKNAAADELKDEHEHNGSRDLNSETDEQQRFAAP